MFKNTETKNIIARLGLGLVLLGLAISCKKSVMNDANTISVAWWGDVYNTRYIKRLKTIYEKKYPERKIKIVSLEQKKYTELLLSRLATRTMPDVIQGTAGGNYHVAKAGGFMPLDAHLQTPEHQEWMQQINPGSLEGCRVEKKLYSIPIWDNVMAVFYNRDITEAAGLTVPRDVKWTEFAQLARKVTVPNERFGISNLPQGFGSWGLWMVFKQWGVDTIKANGNLDLTHPNVLKVLQLFQNLNYRDKVVLSKELQRGGGQNPEMFQSGKIGFSFVGRWGYDSLAGGPQGMNFGVIRYPYQTQRYMVNASMSLGVSSQCEKVEQALHFISFVVSEEGQQYVFQMRTDMPVNKTVLNSDAFIQSAKLPDYDRMFRSAYFEAETTPEILKSTGVREWSQKVWRPFMEGLLEAGTPPTDFTQKVTDEWKAIVLPQL